jgi:hypothetical protein
MVGSLRVPISRAMVVLRVGFLQINFLISGISSYKASSSEFWV